MSVASSQGPPTSWAPIGSPSPVRCRGRLIAGWPVMLNRIVNATICSTGIAGSAGLACAASRTTAATGVEMEALTAASVAALTVYDMVKGIERGVEIAEVVLLEKTGGKEDWSR